MIGGKVHNTFRFDDRISIAVRGTGSESKDWCAVDVGLDAPAMKYGDGIWWQSNLVWWTPQDGTAQDIHVPRIGYSYGIEYLWQKVAERCRAGICPECANPQTMHDGLGGLWCDRCGASYNMTEVTA